MECVVYSENDFVSLLSELCEEDSTSGDSSGSSSLVQPKRKVHRVAKKLKVEVAVNDGNTIEFEASFPRPRIIRSDIRRSYSSMFVNILNSGDFRMVFGFYDTFCVPTFSNSVTRIFTVGSELKSFTSKSVGLVNSTKYWQYGANKFPDASMMLKNTTILSKEDESASRVSFTFEFRATKIYDDPGENADFQLSPELSHLLSEETPEGFNNAQTMLQDVTQAVQQYPQRLVLKASPIPIHAEGVMNMYLDAFSRITRVEMVSTAIQ